MTTRRMTFNIHRGICCVQGCRLRANKCMCNKCVCHHCEPESIMVMPSGHIAHCGQCAIEWSDYKIDCTPMLHTIE